MPIREYLCPKCNYRWEVFHKGINEIATECPECKNDEALIRLLAAPSVHFKGSGYDANRSLSRTPSKQVTFGGDGTVSEVEVPPTYTPPPAP